MKNSSNHWGWGLVFVVALLGLGHLGVELLRPNDAAAQSRRFTTCFVARQETVDVGNDSRVERPGRDRQVAVPQGWTVVAGGGMDDGNHSNGAILFCR